MNKALAILFCFFSMACHGVESEFHRSVSVDIFDQDSVRRGAGYFAYYCQGCHGVKQIRYSRIGADLEIGEDAMRREFMLGDTKIHEYVRTAMLPKDAESTFGVTPPDLSLIVRARSADWIFSYLKGFYEDPKRPFGVNNAVVPNVAMPNVLWEFQGPQDAVTKLVDGNTVVVDVKSSGAGKMSEKQFDEMLTDIVNYLAYVSEPAKLQRLPLGKYVLVFLIGLTVLLYKLKKEYWKEID